MQGESVTTAVLLSKTLSGAKKESHKIRLIYPVWHKHHMVTALRDRSCMLCVKNYDTEVVKAGKQMQFAQLGLKSNILFL